MFFPGAVSPREGKQRSRPRLVSISAGWRSHSGGERNVRVRPPRLRTKTRFSAGRLWVEQSGRGGCDCDNVPLLLGSRARPEGQGVPRIPEQGANRNPAAHPRSASPAPLALGSPPAALSADLEGHLVPGGGVGLAGQPRQEGGSDPGRSRGAEAEEPEQLPAGRPGAFTSPGVKAGPLP